MEKYTGIIGNTQGVKKLKIPARYIDKYVMALSLWTAWPECKGFLWRR